VDVSSRSGADLPIRGDGCVAADFNLDGHTDLYVTSAGYNVATDSWDALLWNNGDGTFTEGAVQAGINAKGWHAAAVVGDVNGDGRPDLFVSSYTDPNFVVDPASGLDRKADVAIADGKVFAIGDVSSEFRAERTLDAVLTEAKEVSQ